MCLSCFWFPFCFLAPDTQSITAWFYIVIFASNIIWLKNRTWNVGSASSSSFCFLIALLFIFLCCWPFYCVFSWSLLLFPLHFFPLSPLLPSFLSEPWCSALFLQKVSPGEHSLWWSLFPSGPSSFLSAPVFIVPLFKSATRLPTHRSHTSSGLVTKQQVQSSEQPERNRKRCLSKQGCVGLLHCAAGWAWPTACSVLATRLSSCMAPHMELVVLM